MRVGIVCRFKPVHVAHALILEQLCREADEVLIGIGSSNRYDARNPFTLEESADMLEATLAPRFQNYELLEVPDLGNGPRWRAMIEEGFGDLDRFVSANDYVSRLLEPVYELVHPRDVVPRALHVPVDGSGVRLAMARGGPWEQWVPPAVADYLHANELPERFRREFGLATLSLATEAKKPEEVHCVLLG